MTRGLLVRAPARATDPTGRRQKLYINGDGEHGASQLDDFNGFYGRPRQPAWMASPSRWL